MAVFELEGTIVPKARPRFSGGHAYLPSRYRDWKDFAIAQLRQQTPIGWEPPTVAAVRVVLMGSHRGDADNIAGACLDALVQAGVLADDSLNHVASVELHHCPKCSPKRTVITILEHRQLYGCDAMPLLFSNL